MVWDPYLTHPFFFFLFASVRFTGDAQVTTVSIGEVVAVSAVVSTGNKFAQVAVISFSLHVGARVAFIKATGEALRQAARHEDVSREALFSSLSKIKIFSRFFVTSNFTPHAWSIKYRQK